MEKKLVLVDCNNDKCPIPFIKTRNALLKSSPTTLIKVVGDDERSYYELIMALEVWNVKVLKIDKKKERWEILFVTTEKGEVNE